jgi:hypothetical protein
MASAITVDRADWLGYRWWRHGLDGDAGPDLLGDLLLLGVQDSRQGGAEQSLAQRTGRIGATPHTRPSGDLARRSAGERVVGARRPARAPDRAPGLRA